MSSWRCLCGESLNDSLGPDPSGWRFVHDQDFEAFETAWGAEAVASARYKVVDPCGDQEARRAALDALLRADRAYFGVVLWDWFHECPSCGRLWFFPPGFEQGIVFALDPDSPTPCTLGEARRRRRSDTIE